MGVGQTGRIIEHDFRRAIYLQVEEYDRRKAAKKSRGFGKFLKRSIKCSQCQRGMLYNIGKQQIDNKRENAPICIPCIMGTKRRPLSEAKKDQKRYSKESQKVLKKLMKRRYL